MHRRSVRPGEGGAWRRAVVRMWGRAASGRRPTFFEPRVARPFSAHRWRDPFLGRRWQLFSFSWRAASLFKSSFCKIPGHGLVVLAVPIVPPIHGCALAAKEASGPWFCQENEKKWQKGRGIWSPVIPRSLRDVSDALAWGFRPGALRSIGARPFSCFLLSKRSASPIRTSGPRERSLRRACAPHLPP